MSVNKVFLVGNLGQDPELKTTKTGKPFCRINVATHERGSLTTGQDFERTTWHSVHVFGKQAEWVGQRLHKGSRVFVEARLEKIVEEMASGEKRSQYFLHAFQVSSFAPTMIRSEGALGDEGDGANDPGEMLGGEFIVPNA